MKRVIEGIERQLEADIEGIKKKFKKDKDYESFTKNYVEKQTLFYKINHYSEKLKKNLFDYEDSI